MSAVAARPWLSELPVPALLEAGHYTLTGAKGGETVFLPSGEAWGAATSETTRRTFAMAAAEVARLRHHGETARLGLLVGDLGLPHPRPGPGAWAIPPSYGDILDEAGIDPDDVLVWSESYARNLGGRMLSAARGRPPERTYQHEGWALLEHEGVWRLASDASLEWEADQRAVALERAGRPLCPLVFAGLKRAVFRAGFKAHVAFYAIPDDPWIDVKLRTAAAAAAQLSRGARGLAVDCILWSSTLGMLQRRWPPGELVGPGERRWPEFLRELDTGRAASRPEVA